jgi:hypothetical protein
VVGGDEAEISVDWPVPPENNYPRMIRVVVDPCNVQDDPNWNNAVSFNVLAPDLTIGEMDVHTAGPNSIITVRVANRGVLPAYDMNNQIKVVLTDPDGLSLREKDIQGIAPMTYYDVSFTLSSVPAAKMIYAIVDPSNAIDEFNEDNNTRSIRIR